MLKYFYNIIVTLFIFIIFGCDENPIAPDIETIKWTSMDSQSTVNFHSVWGSSSQDVYAIGDGLLFHYNGLIWSKVELDTTYFINAIWGNNAKDLYAVGKSGLLIHYDGTSWNKIETMFTENLTDISGINSSSIIIQNGARSFSSLVNGTFTPNILDTKYIINGLWGVYDIPFPLANNKTYNYFYIGGVGSIGISIDNKFGKIFVTPALLSDVHGTNMRNVFVVGLPSIVIYFDGLSANVITIPFLVKQPDIKGVWTTSKKSAYFVSNNGAIYYLNDSIWREQQSGTSEDLQGIWGSPSGNLFIVGDNGTILLGTN